MHRLKKINSNANVLFEVLHMHGIYADNHGLMCQPGIRLVNQPRVVWNLIQFYLIGWTIAMGSLCIKQKITHCFHQLLLPTN